MAKRIRQHARDVVTALERAMHLLNNNHLVPCQRVVDKATCIRRELSTRRTFRVRGRATRREPTLAEARIDQLCDACKAFLHVERAASAMYAVLRVPEAKLEYFEAADPTVPEG